MPTFYPQEVVNYFHFIVKDSLPRSSPLSLTFSLFLPPFLPRSLFLLQYHPILLRVAASISALSSPSLGRVRVLLEVIVFRLRCYRFLAAANYLFTPGVRRGGDADRGLVKWLAALIGNRRGEKCRSQKIPRRQEDQPLPAYKKVAVGCSLNDHQMIMTFKLGG